MLRKNRICIVAAGALLGAITLTPQIAEAQRGGGGRGGGGAVRASAPSSIGRGASGASRANAGNMNRGSVNTGNVNRGNVNTGNVNRGNVNTGNINTGNVNVNRNVNIDNGYGWDDHYHPVARGVAVGTAAAVTAAAVGSMMYSLPPACSPYAGSYYYCGGVYYAPQYQGDKVVYVVVNKP